MGHRSLSGSHGSHEHHGVVGVHQRGHNEVVADGVNGGHNDLVERSSDAAVAVVVELIYSAGFRD